MSPKDLQPPMGVIRKFPSFREANSKTVDDWLKGKQVDDGAEGLWRIHDDLYDLSTFLTRHPGGCEWIELTKGTDITEAFEVHHLTDSPTHMLPKFHVRRAITPRNSLVTFKENGFYKTLRKKIKNQIPESGPAFRSKLLADSLAISCLLLAVLGAKWGNGWPMLSGVFLHMLTVCSHNFIHMKDNWRMYYLNTSLMSYRDWRISHVLSHHLFPNTIIDLEVSLAEPFLCFLPDPKKTILGRFIPWIISPIVFVTMFHFQFLRRLTDVILSKKRFQFGDFFSVLPLFLIWLFSGSSISTAFITWNVVIVTASTIFGIVSFTAAHHHPDIYHEGDQFTSDKDFAMLQLAAVRDRIEVTGSYFLVMISFGDHILHHLFPTIDHYHLPKLYPIFYETCKEFGVNNRLYSWTDLLTGMYKQLARNYRNARLIILDQKKAK